MYLDPGFGSMLIQILIAAFAGISAAWFAFRNKLKKKHGTASDAAASTDDEAITDAPGKTDGAPEAAQESKH